ncbi:MAG TPA: ABC transporter permease [Candidatus Acidoferrales bacterium]|nr:ABC transporter permease [Candidatus Acidoferrales bacterium]
MLAGDTLRLAFEALRAHKLRTALTLLGLVIGVTSLILVMTLIQGANVYVETKIANLGTDIFQVSKLPLASTDFREVLRARKNRDVTIEDWRAVQERCRQCAGVGAQIELPGRIKSDFQSMPDVSIRGQTANMAWISTLDIAEGRFFSVSEQRAAAPLAIVGDEVRERLFQGRDTIGKKIRIGGGEFEIVGEAERIGSILGQSQDNFVIIPIDAFEKLYGARRSLILHVKAFSKDSLTPTEDEVRLILRSLRHTDPLARDGFYFTTAATYLDLWRDISSVFFIVLVLISSVASMVGGIVIMNITLVSVTERTKEIGLRRSVGARQRDIARQFLVEVLAQCLVGGLTGVTLGFTVALLLRQFTPFPAVVQMWVAAMGLTLASAIALIFGIYPAIRAAKLDPVVALRSE